MDINKEKESLKENKYQSAISLFNSGLYDEAERLFDGLRNYKESNTYLSKCISANNNIQDSTLKEQNKAVRKVNLLTFVGVLLFVALAIGTFIISISISNSGYSQDKIELSVLSKEGVILQDSYSEIDLAVEIKNMTSHNIRDINGTLSIRDNNNIELVSGNATINLNSLSPKSNANNTLRLRIDGNNAEKLYYSDLSQLTIGFTINGVRFDDSYKSYKSSERILNKANNSFSYDNNQSEQNENAGYSDWEQEMLADLKDVAGDDAVMPDYYDIESYSTDETIEHRGNNYNCFFADIVVPEEQVDTFSDNFRHKLLENTYEELNDHCYRKDSTVVYFVDPTLFDDGYHAAYYAFVE